MRDFGLERDYETMKVSKGEKSEGIAFAQSTVLGTKTDSADFEWNSLSPIGAKGLKLFESCKGSVLRGTIIALPAVATGITTFLQDDSGVIVRIGLYNFVPGKMNRLDSTEYVRNRLRSGTKVEIAEPFTKIFFDGNRGVRIDDPREFRIEEGHSSDLASARHKGNDFFRKKQFQAAVESYTSGLQQESLIPTLLSNRAQAFINLERWADGLADAAASLTIRPGCEKTLHRYQKATKQVLAQQEQSKSAALRVVLEPNSWHSPEVTTPSPHSLEQLKNEGNEAFKNRDYERAIETYTTALLASDGNVRAVLGNWSQASLELRCYHEALAAAAASMRIWTDDKAIYRLCKALAQLNETELAMDLLQYYGGSAPGLIDLKSALFEYASVLPLGDNDRAMMASPPMICPDWASTSIETFYDSAKGRGIRARDPVPSDCLLIVETPLSVQTSDDEGFSFTYDQNRTMHDKAQALLQASIMNRIQRDQLLSERMSYLYDGTTPPPLVKLQDLLNSVGVANAPLLLPPRPDFFSSKCPPLTANQIRSILSINSFGSVDPTASHQQSLAKKESLIYSAVSMFNHSFEPNCLIVPYSGSSRAVVTCRAVKEGEELTISYHKDPNVLKEKWGIKR